MTAAAARPLVLARYRELLRLIARLPEAKRTDALREAQQTIRSRRGETDAERLLAHQKELAAKIGYLRIVTPKQPSDVSDSGFGRYVLRDGQLVQGVGASKGERVADGVLSMDEAQKLNNKHFERFYGKKKSKDMFF